MKKLTLANFNFNEIVENWQRQVAKLIENLYNLIHLFSGVIAHFYSLLRNQVAPLTDERIRIVNEIIPGMRVIKMYGWEKQFLKTTDRIRK